MKLYELPEGTGIFLTPSETDAQYIPILVAKSLNNTDEDYFLNILTGKDEFGSSTLCAASGLFFSNAVPNPGYAICRDSFVLIRMWEGLEMISLNNRREKDGLMVDQGEAINLAIDRCFRKGKIPIL